MRAHVRNVCRRPGEKMMRPPARNPILLKRKHRSDEAVPAEGLAFSPHGFQIVHRPYFAASFGGWLPQREVIEFLMITTEVGNNAFLIR